MQNSKRNLLIFVGILIFVGLLHIIEHTIHDISALGDAHYAIVTFLFCLEFVIYQVLIIFWIVHINIVLQAWMQDFVFHGMPTIFQ